MPEQAQIIRWEEPPPATRGRGGRPIGTYSSRFADIAAQLRAHPGRWALIDERTEGRARASSLASQISHGVIRCFAPAGDFEGAGRRVNGVHRTYARWLGDGWCPDV